MKTVGQLLLSTRHKKGLNLDQISHIIKIRKNYLEHLEADEYHLLPSAPYTRGFIKNYAQYLDLNPQTLLAVFRRDFAEDETGQIIPRSMLSTPPTNPWWYSRVIVFTLVGFTLAVFAGFLIFQYTSLIRPKLIVTLPTEGQIYSGSIVVVTGIADSSSVVRINNQLVSLSQSGQFETEVNVGPGTQQITIQATNRRQNTTQVTKTIVVRPQAAQ